MSVARRFAAALAVVGAGVLAYAGPASAHDSAPPAPACVDGTVNGNLDRSVDFGAGKAIVHGVDGRPICAGKEVTLTLSIYRVPLGWDGSAFPGGHERPDGKAVPQHEITHDTKVLAGSEPVELTVPVPDCGNLQIDLYTGESIPDVLDAGHPGARILFGHLWTPGSTDGKPLKCAPPSAPTTPAKPPTAPAKPPTAQPVVVPVATPSTPPVAAAPPQLPQTGSDSTLPVLGLGVALLGAGIGLSLLGRRRAT